MRYIPIVLLFGILANFVCVVVFRLKLDREYDKRFSLMSDTINAQVHQFSVDALRSIDMYFVSNSVLGSVSSGSDSPSELKADVVFYDDGGDWSYDYFLSDGVSLARVGCVYFRIGDNYPRGGRISAIYPDSVVIDGKYHVRNSSFVSVSRSSSQSQEMKFVDSTYKSNKELMDYVK